VAKIETITFKYEHCGECPHCGGWDYPCDICDLTKKKTPSIWGKIPKWCPLKDAEVINLKLSAYI